MLIQANTLQLTYLLYIIINVSNLAAYSVCRSVQYGIELFNFELINGGRDEKKEITTLFLRWFFVIYCHVSVCTAVAK